MILFIVDNFLHTYVTLNNGVEASLMSPWTINNMEENHCLSLNILKESDAEYMLTVILQTYNRDNTVLCRYANPTGELIN